MIKSSKPSFEQKNMSMPDMKVKTDALAYLPLEELFKIFSQSSTPPRQGMDTQTFLDEWLANDLHHTGFLSETEDTTSPIQEVLPSNHFPSPLSPALTSNSSHSSPALGFEPMTPNFAGMSTPHFSSPSPPIIGEPEKNAAFASALSLFPDLASDTKIGSLDALSAAVSGFQIPWGVDNAAAPRQVPRDPSNLHYPSVPITLPIDLTLSASKPRGVKRASPTQAPELLDEVTLKRQKNTDAARRSRLRKVMKMEALEKRVTDMESQNSKLVLRVAVLESEKNSWESKENDYEKRIKKLETQLHEAHKLLTSRLVPANGSS